MRLLVVDDHEVVRRGVRSLLTEQEGWEVCAEAVDGQDALEKAREFKPDLIVMDVSMPRLNGLEATRQVRNLLPQCEVLILSQHENSEMARQALTAGARGYVVKSSISRDLISAVAKVSRHEYFFDPAVLDQTPTAHTDVQEILQRSAAFEKALRESEERLRKLAEYQSAVMNNMAEGLYALDANGLLTSINPAAEAILGWRSDELIGKKMHDVTHYKRPDGPPFPADECPGLQVVQKGISLREHEDTFIRKDGSFVPVVFSASPRKEDGRIAGVIVSFRDDTEQRRAREALRDSREQLSLALHSSRTAMFDWDLVQQRGKWNSQMARIYGFMPSGDYITIEEWKSLFHPEDTARLAVEAERVWRGKDEEFTFEFRTVQRQGEIRWILSHGRIVRDSDGNAVRMIGTHTDITEAKRAQEALEQSESRIRAAFSQSYSFLVLLQPDGTIIEANRAALEAAGATDSSQVIGRKFWEPWWSPLPDEGATLKNLIEKVRTGERVRDECVFCLPDGSRRVGDRTLNPIFDGQGGVAMIVATGMDITERKQSETAIASRARQQKALFHLADELHRAASMEDVYNAALNAILDALQCNRASILLCDDAGAMHFKSWRGLSNDYRAATDGHSAWRPDERNPQPVCITDINAADLTESLKAVIRKEGIGALAFIPLVLDGKLTGKFMVHFNAPHQFAPDEIDLSLTIARQLSFAIQRRRNDEALEQSRAHIQAEASALFKLNASSSRLWQTRTLHDGLNEMLSATIELLGADKGNVQILDAERGLLTIEAQRGFEKEFLEFFREVSADDDTACGRALRTGERIVIEDVIEDIAFAPYREIARAAGYRAVVSTPLIGKDGAPLGILSTHFSSPHRPSDQDLRRLDLYARQAADFIERCRTDETLRESNKAAGLLAAIVTSSDDAIVSKDLDGIIKTWNTSAERIFGYTAQEAISQQITLIIPPDRLAEEDDILARIRRGEKIDHFQTVRRRKDGTLIDVSVTISPVYDSSGRVIGASKVARDITAQKRAEQALREGEQRYQTLTDASPVMIWMAGRDRLCYYFNKGWLDFVGRRIEQELGNGWAENVHPDDVNRCLQLYADNFDAHRPFEMEYRLRHHTGQYRWLFARGIPRYAADGTFEGYVGACLDIHERKQAAEKMRMADETMRLMKAQDEERRRIAREFHDSAGQTLTVLGLSLAQLVQDSEIVSPELAKQGRQIEEVVQQLHREIRTTSYLLHPPLLDEAGLSSALEWYVQGVAERGRMAIDFNIPGDFGRLPADMELAIFRVVQECLTNIHRHAESKTATIRIARENGSVWIEVRDEGKGISPERLAEIESRGSGVGISGIRERLRHFGGTMKIESDQTGTRVIASIPLAVAPSSEGEHLQVVV